MSEVARVRQTHPLAGVVPLIRELLRPGIALAGVVVLRDGADRVLWVEGEWDGQVGQEVRVSAPIHEPETGVVLGVVDLIGGPEIAAEAIRALLRATVLAAEYRLEVTRLRHQPAAVGRAPMSRLEVLGVSGARYGDGAMTTRLSLRHSEVLLLLATHPDGLTAADLAIALSGEVHASVTVRAELSRLRQLLGTLGLEARPYRLADPVDLDIADVREALRGGLVRRAVALYRGPVLPTSQSPGVEELRRSLHEEVRSHVLACDDPATLMAFAESDHGRDDFEVWYAALKLLPVSSPYYGQALAHCERLEGDLAVRRWA